MVTKLEEINDFDLNWPLMTSKWPLDSLAPTSDYTHWDWISSHFRLPIPNQSFPPLTSNDLKRPCIYSLCTPWRKHYLRNTMTDFQEHAVLGEKEDTFLLRFSHNSLYWPLNDLWPPLLVGQKSPHTHWSLHPSFIKIQRKINVWELVEDIADIHRSMDWVTTADSNSSKQLYTAGLSWKSLSNS